ncbi:MAG: hypothetical protein AAF918_16945 [Pseudomonadota bacterium]
MSGLVQYSKFQAIREPEVAEKSAWLRGGEITGKTGVIFKPSAAYMKSERVKKQLEALKKLEEAAKGKATDEDQATASE